MVSWTGSRGILKGDLGRRPAGADDESNEGFKSVVSCNRDEQNVTIPSIQP